MTTTDITTTKTYITWQQVHDLAGQLVTRLRSKGLLVKQGGLNVFPVPRGGIHVAQAMQVEAVDRYYHLSRINIVSTPVEADLIVDDLIDSGKTAHEYSKFGKDFAVLIDKRGSPDIGWVVFPWEVGEAEGAGPHDAVVRLLQFIGEDVNRPGLIDTPARVIRSFEEIYGGYRQNPADIMRTFDERCDEMVVLRDCEFYSVCEHHMLPFFGRAHIAYVPNGRVIGVSKLARVLDIFSRRLQIQERLTQQVTAALDEHLHPLGSACVLNAQHFCMVCRGARKQNASMITSSLTGVFRTSAEARAEFMSMISG